MKNFTPPHQLLYAEDLSRGGMYGDLFDANLEQSVYRRFEIVARRYPNRTAIEFESGGMSYAELNCHADQIARTIETKDSATGDVIGVCLPNGAGLFAVLLGIWKAQRTVALFDPLSPRNRLAALVADSQARWIYISEATDFVGEPCATDVMFKSDSREIGKSQPETAAAVSFPGMAAIFYTSGSSGAPKGVIATHTNLLHQTMLFTESYRLCSADRFALLSAGSSSAVTSALMALLNGATVLPFDVRASGTNQLARWLVERKVSICMLGAPLFRSLAHTLNGDETFPDLRLIRLRSDTVNVQDLELFKKLFPKHCVLVNGLSSTETGLMTLCFFDHESTITDQEVPVGYAAPDKEILLLDDDGKEVGFNVVGEIVVKSRYLAPGYWRNAELTAAKFKDDPEGTDKRVYFTADLGLMRSDGCIIHKGRKDFRVKIRGYGVELAEVEAALRAHPALEDLVVVALRNSEVGEFYLVVYFTARGQPKPNATELRSFMQAKLPDYMVPSAFVPLDAFPLTPSGKIDRRALPVPGNSRPNLATVFVAPRSRVEEELARIWSEILNLDTVGVHDNFFELGGHSLAATRVVSQVIKRFQLAMPLRKLFESPTIVRMAQVIEESQDEKITSEELERCLSEIEAMSEEDAQRSLDGEVGSRKAR